MWSSARPAVRAGKWNGVTVAVKVVEHAALPGGTNQLSESVMGQSIVHPNIVATYKIRTMCAPTSWSHPRRKTLTCCRHGDI